MMQAGQFRISLTTSRLRARLLPHIMSCCSLPHSAHFACTKSPPPDDLHLDDSLTPKCELLHTRPFNGSGRLATLQPIRAQPSVFFLGQRSGTLHEVSTHSATGL